MAYQGQVCCAGSRTYVQEDVYDKFIEHAKKAAEDRVISDTFAPGCQHGPQVYINLIGSKLRLLETQLSSIFRPNIQLLHGISRCILISI